MGPQLKTQTLLNKEVVNIRTPCVLVCIEIRMIYQHWSIGFKFINKLIMITIETTLQALQWAYSCPPLETVELLYIAVRQVGRASLVSRRLNEPACWGHVGKTTQPAAGTILYISSLATIFTKDSPRSSVSEQVYSAAFLPAKGERVYRSP